MQACDARTVLKIKTAEGQRGEAEKGKGKEVVKEAAGFLSFFCLFVCFF